MKNKKWAIFGNAFLCGIDTAVGILNLFEGSCIMGSMLLVLGIGLGWLSWRELNE